MSLAPIDPTNEVAVTDYLTRARDWLSRAVDETGPEQIAAAKAEIATAAEATKQLGLSREIQLDAQEMVRRAEYALGKAIRKGQQEGTVASESNHNRLGVPSTAKARPSDFASDVELYDRPSQHKAGILSIADAATPEEFDAAIEEAKSEGNLSRANVARKVKGTSGAKTRETAGQRAAKITELAAQGATSAQIAKELGIVRAYVKRIAAEYGIEIAADAVRSRAHNRNHMRVLDNVTEAVEVAAMSLRDIDPAQLDEDEARERLDSLTTSISALSKATKKIKESFRG